MLRISVVSVALALVLAQTNAAEASKATKKKQQTVDSNQLVTPHLKNANSNFDVVAISTREDSKRIAKALKVENAVCNFGNDPDPKKRLVFDWPSAGFFSQGGGSVPAQMCKVTVRDGIAGTEVDSEANILLTTQRQSFAAPTFRRIRDNIERTIDRVSSSVGLRSVAPGSGVIGSDMSITTFFKEKRIELNIDGDLKNNVIYLALPALPEQQIQALTSQLQQPMFAKTGSRIGTREAVLRDMVAEDVSKANELLGSGVKHVVRLQNVQKAALTWSTNAPANSPLRWAELRVLLTDSENHLTTAFTYASPE